MTTPDPVHTLAQSVQSIFIQERGGFHAIDFMAVAELLGFTAYPRPNPTQLPLPIAGNHIPDLIGVNLEHALTTYAWGDLRPLSDDGVTVSGVWQSEHPDEGPPGYVLSDDRRCWRRA